jgi:hypothetical protein
MLPIKLSLVLLALIWQGFGPSAAEESTFSVALAGLDGQKAVLTLAELDSLPRFKISATQHGASHEFEGALLGDVLAKVNAPAGKAVRGQELADVIVIEARDGYKVALDLAGTDPAMHAGQRVILADYMDRKPLDENNGPFQLVVEGDLRPARAVRMVSTIRLERVR